MGPILYREVVGGYEIKMWKIGDIDSWGKDGGFAVEYRGPKGVHSRRGFTDYYDALTASSMLSAILKEVSDDRK